MQTILQIVADVRNLARVLICSTCVYRCVTVSVSVIVMIASILLTVHSLDAEAVTIATRPLLVVRHVSLM